MNSLICLPAFIYLFIHISLKYCHIGLHYLFRIKIKIRCVIITILLMYKGVQFKGDKTLDLYTDKII